MASLSDADKERTRYHLGYPHLTQGTSLYAGLAFSTQVLFVLEGAMDNVHANAIARITKTLDILDDLETRMIDALDRLKAAKADVVTLNPTEGLDLEVQYKRWQQKLSEILSVPVNPSRPNNGGDGLNMRVLR